MSQNQTAPRLMAPYRLPDGRIVPIDPDVARGAEFVSFELESHGGPRVIVNASRVTVVTAPPIDWRGTLTGLRCYVVGCEHAGEPGAVRSVRHRSFGLVSACEWHDPNRAGCGADLVSAELARYGAPASGVMPQPGGGARVPVVPVVPRLPPGPVALTVAPLAPFAIPDVSVRPVSRVAPVVALPDCVDPF